MHIGNGEQVSEGTALTMDVTRRAEEHDPNKSGHYKNANLYIL